MERQQLAEKYGPLYAQIMPPGAEPWSREETMAITQVQATGDTMLAMLRIKSREALVIQQYGTFGSQLDTTALWPGGVDAVPMQPHVLHTFMRWDVVIAGSSGPGQPIPNRTAVQSNALDEDGWAVVRIESVFAGAPPLVVCGENQVAIRIRFSGAPGTRISNLGAFLTGMLSGYKLTV